MKISAQVLVENEENFVWFSVMSVLPYVDEVVIYDAGSVDQTSEILNIIKKMYPGKVAITKIGKLTPKEYPSMREKMLKNTTCDWILVVDGDEIWWTDQLQLVLRKIQIEGKELDSIVTPFVNCVGDIFHFQTEKAGRYIIDRLQGHHTIRAINTEIRELHVQGDYGKEGYVSQTIPVQDLDETRRIHMKGACFLHTSYLKRTSNNSKKLKHELGIETSLDFYYPEVFFREYPSIVPYPFQTLGTKEKFLNSGVSKLKYAKRKIHL